MRIFEERVPCVSPRRVDGNLDAIRQFVADRDGLDSVPFWRAICALQSPEVALPPTRVRPHLVWDPYDAAGVSSALRDLMAVETLAPGCAYTDVERQRSEPVIRDGLRSFRRHFPETFPVFRNAVPFVLLAKKAGHAGGSVSTRLGFVWLAPIPSWTAEDCGEHLWHEYVHQTLFLEDMTRSIFRRDTGALSAPGNMTVSAVRGVPRRFDQSFHSAFVGAGIVEYRARSSKISAARAVFPTLWPCLAALVRKRDLLTDNGAEQLDHLVECVLQQADELDARDRRAPTVR